MILQLPLHFRRLIAELCPSGFLLVCPGGKDQNLDTQDPVLYVPNPLWTVFFPMNLFSVFTVFSYNFHTWEWPLIHLLILYKAATLVPNVLNKMFNHRNSKKMINFKTGGLPFSLDVSYLISDRSWAEEACSNLLITIFHYPTKVKLRIIQTLALPIFQALVNYICSFLPRTSAKWRFN